VAGYSPIRSELDPTPLLLALAAKGARLALPVITQRGQSLRFRVCMKATGCCRIARHSRAVAGRGRGRARYRTGAAGGVRPHRHRIGYGAGHYDRTLANLHKSKGFAAIGLAFSARKWQRYRRCSTTCPWIMC